jgi:site-specific recombinase XerD
MEKHEVLGPWIRRFLLEYLVHERNMSPNTQRSYRDALRMFLPFISVRVGKELDRLEVQDMSADAVRGFLQHVEEQRKVSIRTRNQRLAAIHSLARYIAEHSPQHIAWYGGVRTVPFKRASRGLVLYLEKSEVEAILAVPDCSTSSGHRNYVLLLFLYNSGSRASEAADLCIADLDLGRGPNGTASVCIKGKGGKVRRCPLWNRTADELARLIEGRSEKDRVFLNRYGEPLTRYGMYALVRVCVAQAAKHMPSLLSKRVSPHTLRHTTATHLLRAGVDINTIRSWLGHVSLDTTHVYAEVDLEMKARALEQCDVGNLKTALVIDSGGLMAFLKTI